MQAALHVRATPYRFWPVTPLMCGVLLGTAVQLQQRHLWWPVVYGLLLCAGVALTAWSAMSRWRVRQIALMVGCAVGVFALAGLRSAHFAAAAMAPELEGRDLTVQGMVASMPQVRDYGLRFRFEVERATLNGQPVAMPALIELTSYTRGLYGTDEAPAPTAGLRFVPGERWQFDVRLKAPHGSSNPFGFDYELWMWEQGVLARGYVRSGSPVVAQRLQRTLAHPVERLRQRVRDAIRARLWEPRGDSKGGEPRAAGLVVALVTGDQQAIAREDWAVFRVTGVAHLVSISGLHITMFAWLAMRFIGRLWRAAPALCLRLPAQHAGAVGGVWLAAAYALFSGWGVPAQRTIFMLTIMVALRIAGRRWPWTHVWLLACAGVLLWDPWAMLQAGFWLSFVAVGILFASDVQESLAAPAQPPVRGAVSGAVSGMVSGARHLWHWLRAQWQQQWLITVALTPLTLLLFGQVSVVGLVANMWAIPWVTLVVLPVAFMGVVWSPAWDAAAWAAHVFLQVLQWLAALPMAQATLVRAPLWAALAAVMGGVVLALRWPWQVRMLALVLFVPALWWQHPRPSTGRFEVLAVDVGQGQAALVRTATHSLLFDAGPRYSAVSDAGALTLVPLLRALGERLDLVVLSHRDSDHTGGAEAVLNAFPGAAVIGALEPQHRIMQSGQASLCAAGRTWSWDGVRFTILHPYPETWDRVHLRDVVASRSNRVSCVLRVEDAHGRAALMVGDIEQMQERDLLARNAIAPADWLLVPHHGSKSSSGAPFIDAVQPRFAIVQAGYRNRYGHPAPDVAARYRERGVALVETVDCGAALWRSDRPEAIECQRDVERRYWHHSRRGTRAGQGL